jgi:hypothetical protein
MPAGEAAKAESPGQPGGGTAVKKTFDLGREHLLPAAGLA